jgi:hypothetical protein
VLIVVKIYVGLAQSFWRPQSKSQFGAFDI